MTLIDTATTAHDRGPSLVSVSARNVTFSVGSRVLVDHVSAEFLGGTFTAIVGPNGAGKSTLLSLLCGDRDPTGGSIKFGNSPIGTFAPLRLAQQRSVVPQQTTPGFSFSVREIVSMGRHPWNCSPAEDLRAIHSALSICGVQALANRSFSSLSGGEQALVNLARVLAQDTSIVFLDEPTAALDVGHQEAVLRIISDLVRSGRTVIMVLHDLNLAARYADRVLLIENGCIVADGTPSECFDGATLSRVYKTPICTVSHPFHAGIPLVLAATI